MVAESVAIQKATPTEIRMDLASGIGLGKGGERFLLSTVKAHAFLVAMEKRWYEVEGAMLT